MGTKKPKPKVRPDDIDLGFDDDPSPKRPDKGISSVGFRKPPVHGQIKKGEVRNPLGAGAHDPMLKAVRRLSAAQVAEIGALVITSNLEGLKKIAENPNSSALQVWMATIAIRGVKTGDAHRLDILLNRLVGRVKETIELSGENGGPIRSLIGAMSPEERAEELARLRAMRKDAGYD